MNQAQPEYAFSGRWITSVESIITNDILVWFKSCSAADKRRPGESQEVGTGHHQDTVSFTVWHTQHKMTVQCRKYIIQDCSHPRNLWLWNRRLCELLPFKPALLLTNTFYPSAFFTSAAYSFLAYWLLLIHESRADIYSTVYRVACCVFTFYYIHHIVLSSTCGALQRQERNLIRFDSIHCLVVARK